MTTLYVIENTNDMGEEPVIDHQAEARHLRMDDAVVVAVLERGHVRRRERGHGLLDVVAGDDVAQHATGVVGDEALRIGADGTGGFFRSDDFHKKTFFRL